MVTKDSFQIRSNVGMTSGFANLFYMEISRWWKSKDWAFQILLWTGIINLSLLGVITENPSELGVLNILGLFFGMFPSIAVVIVMQEVIIGERKAGTVQWILSKPCSRTAFIWSKLISNTIGVIISMVFIPGIVAYFMILLIGNIQFDVVSYLIGLSIISILLIFYLTFAIMLGTLTNQAGLVIGIPLLFNFGILSILQGVKEIFYYVPHGLFFRISEGNSIFSSVVLQQPLESLLPIVLTIIYIVIFVIVSLYKFNKEEF